MLFLFALNFLKLRIICSLVLTLFPGLLVFLPGQVPAHQLPGSAGQHVLRVHQSQLVRGTKNCPVSIKLATLVWCIQLMMGGGREKQTVPLLLYWGVVRELFNFSALQWLAINLYSRRSFPLVFWMTWKQDKSPICIIPTSISVTLLTPSGQGLHHSSSSFP